jgi:hypothetical protein
MSTQGKGNEGFELVTSASLGVVYSRLSYPLETNWDHSKNSFNFFFLHIYVGVFG